MADLFSLDGKKAVVVGGAGGMGRGIAAGLLQYGADLAIAERMPSAVQLRETMRRRRAAGGPAERTFATLVGMELRPRLLREAATLFAVVRAGRGVEERDALWAHPDLLPSPDDLADPLGFIEESAHELELPPSDDDATE